MRFPRQLASQRPLQPYGPGAYDVMWGTDSIRILVLREMPEAEQNVVWNLFSGEQQRIATALARLQPRLQSWSSLVNELLGYYGLEGIGMPYTMEDFEREVEQKILKKLTPEQLLARLTPEQLLARLTSEQLLARLSAEERLEGLPAEQLLSHVPLAEIENYLKKKKAAQDKTSPEPPKPQS